MDLEGITARLIETYPDRQSLIVQLCALVTTSSPSCIHIHAPFSPRLTTSLVHSVLATVQMRYASINGVECLGPRLFFDRILNGLAGWALKWEMGCETFGGGKYSRDLDGFIQGLRVISREKTMGSNMVIVVDNAERFKDNLPDLLVPMTRLAELSDLPITTLFISPMSWFELRPLNGAAIDPFLINAFGTTKEGAINRLVSCFPSRETPPINPYSPSLRSLYAHYASALHSIVSPFLIDDYELSYLAAACWPGFVSPVLADWRAQLEAQGEAMQDTPPFSLPSEEARMRLVLYFSPSFRHALEALYPRNQHALEWARLNAPPVDLCLSQLPIRSAENGQKELGLEKTSRTELTTIAKYVLVAAFLASSNPSKTDVMLIGRAPEERRKRRRGRPRKMVIGGVAKVPQRLLGPAAFPLDRLIAILGSLMEEHDEDGPTINASLNDRDDDQDMEKDTELAVGGVEVSATISELVTMRLLHRTTPIDKLDGPPCFKSGISQARAFELARELDISTLADLMWDPDS